MLRAIAASLLLLAFVPLAGAAHEPCVAQNVGGQDQPLYVFLPGARTVEVWQESNGAPGLQRDACVGAGGVPRAVDTFVGAFAVPGVPCINLGGTILCVV